MIYGAKLDLKWGVLIIMCHVLLDNLVMGSLVPHVMIPMFLGYLITLFAGFVSRNRSIWIKCCFCVLAILIYTQLFALSSILLYDVSYIVYMTGDLPFTIVLIVFSVITMIWLYEPISKIIESKKIVNNKKV